MPVMIRLINDKDQEIQKAAIRSAGQFASKELVQHLVPLLRLKPLKKEVRHALVSMQETGVEEFSLLSFFKNDPVVKELIRISSIVAHQASVYFLMKCIDEHPLFSKEAIYALWRLEFRPDTAHQQKLQEYLRKELRDALDISEQLSVAEQQTNQHLSRALYWELKNKVLTVLYLLCFLIEREKISAVIAALELKESFKTSNCIEMLQVTLPASLFREVNHLLDVVEMNYSLHSVKNRYKNISEVLRGIIGNPPFVYNRWTNAQAIYHTGQYKFNDIISMLKKAREEDDEPIIKETRMFVISLYQ